MIVTIDGPAGAGKSTVARRLAEHLGFEFLDTGAMYRAAALAVTRQGLDLADAEAVANLVSQLNIRVAGDEVWLNGESIAGLIRQPAISDTASRIAVIPAVRDVMVRLQRRIASGGNYVCEGRDQGTVAFPQAECKIYLTASIDERARRRWQQLNEMGSAPPLAEVLEDQRLRDERDANRPVGRLRCADDAHVVNSDGKSIAEVVDEIAALARAAAARAR